MGSHHHFVREYLFDRGDYDGNEFGDPISASRYRSLLVEIDGDVAIDEEQHYDREEDVQLGFAQSRRMRARNIISFALDKWDVLLGKSHEIWLEECNLLSKSLLRYVTDVLIMAPCS